jgi:hypothetical protein
MNKKIIYLFIALLLPILIFLFLKYFGKNEFDIPVYYEKGVEDSLTSTCGKKINGQYVIPDSMMASLKWNGGVMLVIDVDGNEFKAVDELIDEKDPTNFSIFPLSKFSTPEKLSEFKKCVLFIRKPWNAVLIDKQKHIRGYYKVGDRNEMDRLEVELKILLMKH